VQHAGVEQLGLLDHAVDHDFGRAAHLRLDKRHHGDVALNLNVFAQVEALGGGADSKLFRFWRLAGLVAADTPIVAHVDIHGSVDVGLDAPRHVVEAALEADLTGTHLAHSRHVLDSLGDLVPGGVELVGGGIARCFDGVMLEHERIQGDDLGMVVQHVNGQLPRDGRRQRRNLGVNLFLSQHGGYRKAGCDGLGLATQMGYQAAMKSAKAGRGRVEGRKSQ